MNDYVIDDKFNELTNYLTQHLVIHQTGVRNNLSDNIAAMCYAINTLAESHREATTRFHKFLEDLSQLSERVETSRGTLYNEQEMNIDDTHLDNFLSEFNITGVA